MESLVSLMLFCVGARPHGFQTRVDLCHVKVLVEANEISVVPGGPFAHQPGLFLIVAVFQTPRPLPRGMINDQEQLNESFNT